MTYPEKEKDDIHALFADVLLKDLHTLKGVEFQQRVGFILECLTDELAIMIQMFIAKEDQTKFILHTAKCLSENLKHTADVRLHEED